MKLKRGKKSGLAYFSYSDIKNWSPCYDPVKHIPKDWRGTAIDILKMGSIPFSERLWCVCRNEITSDRVMRLFAVWCARQVQHLMIDKRSIDALDVAERFANGLATQEGLDAAWAAARAAAWAAARAAAGDAAWAAAGAAAGDAAGAAAWAAAGAAAWDDAGGAQRDKLIEMLKAEGKEYVAKKKGGPG